MSDSALCPSCGSADVVRFCPHCGQARVHAHDLTFKHLVHTVIHELIHVDGRLWGTLRLLFLRPGQVALDYVEGRRTQYIAPFRFFLVISVVILLLLQTSAYSLEGIVAQARVLEKAIAWGAEQAGMRPATYLAQCNARFQGLMRFHFLYVDTTLIILVASLLWRRQRPAVGNHAVFFLYHSAVVSLGSALLVWLGAKLLPPKLLFLPGFMALIWAMGYLWVGIRRFYGQSTGWRLLKFAVFWGMQVVTNLLAFLVALLMALPILQYARFRGV